MTRTSTSNASFRRRTRGSAAVLGCLAGFAVALPLAAQPPGPPPGGPQALPPRPKLAALPIDQPIRVDGILDDDAWQQAEPAAGFLQREPDTFQPATEPTEVRVAFTHSTLYIAIKATARRVVAEEMQRDAQLFRDDSVILLLDTFHDRRNAFWFETNANGARTDALLTDEGRDFNTQWDGVWESVGRITPEGWTCEVAIPFATLRFDPNVDTWGFNIRRLIRYKSEEAFWAPLPLEANSFRVSLAGELTGIRGPEPGLNLRIKPFGVGSSTAVRDPVFGESEDDVDVGLDVKWGLTRTLTLDLTYNTDFAEVEVDNQQVNLTRFSLFFPEKREFFLENSGIFEFGFNSPGVPYVKPFFSRRIGIGPFGEVVPIDWGARLTGRVGGWSIGLLDAQTDDADLGPFAVPENNWGVLRVKRNVGQRSTVGMIFTNRDGHGQGPFDDYNRVFGLDADLNLSRFLNVAAFWTKSDDGNPLIQGGDDWAGGARILRQGPIWGWGLDAVQIGESYNPESGFLLRNGIRRYVPKIDFRPRPQIPQIPGLLNLIFGATASIITDTDDKLETLEATADLFGLRFRTLDQIVLFADHTKDRLPFPFPIFPGVVIPAGEYEFDDVGVRFETNFSRPVSASGFVLAGDFYGGNRTSGNVNVGWRPSRHVRTDTTWVRDDIDLPGGSFTSNVIRQRLGLAFTPDLSTNTYLQYNDAFDLLSLNLRFRWIYKPGSDLFIVFNQNWNAPGLGDLTRTERQVILKVTYLFEL